MKKTPTKALSEVSLASPSRSISLLSGEQDLSQLGGFEKGITEESSDSISDTSKVDTRSAMN